MQKLTNEKARELLKELQYAKVQMGSLSIRDEYFKQALEQSLAFKKVGEFFKSDGDWYEASEEDHFESTTTLYMRPEAPL